jgi:uncharacterized protein YjiS (DUF1127 family)
MLVNKAVLLYEAEPVSLNFWNAIRSGWNAYLAVRQQRRTLLALSRLHPRLIKDIGYEPDSVYRVLDSPWDELYTAVRQTRRKW